MLKSTGLLIWQCHIAEEVDPPCGKRKVMLALYQIGYLQTNQDRDIMARFQLSSRRVKGFICRKHMAAQNPIHQMLELLNAGLAGNIRFKEGLSSKFENLAEIKFHWKPNLCASQSFFNFLSSAAPRQLMSRRKSWFLCQRVSRCGLIEHFNPTVWFSRELGSVFTRVRISRRFLSPY